MKIFSNLSDECKSSAFTPVTKLAEKSKFACHPFSHRTLLVVVGSETLRKWKEKCLGHFLPIFSTSDTLNVRRYSSITYIFAHYCPKEKLISEINRLNLSCV
ncbi:MAG: hypothetical protein IT569_10375 [Leptospiraceae bacterium]|nr:hypothetical protein [Leptospiraceae bacterium]